MTRFALLLLFATIPAAASAAPDRAITPAERDAVIDGVVEKIVAHYVFPEVGKQMAEAVKKRRANKEYDAITDGRDLADALTKHLREVCKDKHLGVGYFAEPPKSLGAPSAEDEKKMIAGAAARNFGFKKVERLSTGVGLLELEGFMPAEWVGETAAAAMTFLSNSDAVIVDLRKNGGGDPAAVILLCSYFFDEPTHLNDIYTRTTDSTRQFWSHPVVPGKKLGNKDVYVLTAGYTFSGAEEFAYNMQSRKRATIIGETTGGGAHPTRGFRITDHFRVRVPFARSVNPVTKTNWEGTGVQPDVAVPADKALHTAHLMALKKAAEKHAADPDRTAAIKRDIAAVQKELDELGTKPAGDKK